MAGKNVTIQDIADRLGMAKSTVSKALSGATDISEKTRERILGCASEMGYHQAELTRFITTETASILVSPKSRIPLPTES